MEWIREQAGVRLYFHGDLIAETEVHFAMSEDFYFLAGPDPCDLNCLLRGRPRVVDGTPLHHPASRLDLHSAGLA